MAQLDVELLHDHLQLVQTDHPQYEIMEIKPLLLIHTPRLEVLLKMQNYLPYRKQRLLMIYMIHTMIRRQDKIHHLPGTMEDPSPPNLLGQILMFCKTKVIATEGEHQ